MSPGQTKFEPVERLHADEPLALVQLLLRIALCIVAGAVVSGWLALAALHINDNYRVTHYQGVWIAVSEAARAGSLYPPIFDGEHYAGTRYMPLPILLNALASSVVGDPLIGGKLLAAILMATLLALVVFVLRGFSCPWPVALALAAVVVGTETGLRAGTTIGGDALPAVLQVGALAVALRGRGPTAILIAGALAGLAVASKLTGFWALLAVTTWLLLQRQWRRAASFAIACAGSAAVVLGTIQLLTRGRFSEQLLTFSAAGVHSALSLVRGPNQVLYNLLGYASGAVVLIPLAVFGALFSRSWRDLSVIQLAFGYALLLLLVVYADVGTGFNQLLDLVVLTALAAGQLAGRAAASRDIRTGPVVLWAVAVAVVWAAGLDLVRTVGFDLRSAVAAVTTGRRATRAAVVVTGIVKPGDEVLAEDPSIYVALHRRPVVMDPFMVMRLERIHPEWVDPLITRIAERRFDLVVLVVPLENRSLDYWWTDFHFGPRVAHALRESYKFDRSVGPYFVYRPLPDPAVRSPGTAVAPTPQSGKR